MCVPLTTLESVLPFRQQLFSSIQFWWYKDGLKVQYLHFVIPRQIDAETLEIVYSFIYEIKYRNSLPQFCQEPALTPQIRLMNLGTSFSALMEIVSGMNSINAELEEVIKISYGLNHRLWFAFLKIYCSLLISCMAITS